MKILVIDGNNLVHRVFWVSKNQKEKNKYFHVYLFLTSVKSYIQSFLPDLTICVWDEKLENRVNPRKLLYEEYKKTRDTETSKEVHEQNA